jgi:poly(hydroxyalkanoate) granule-associated protein
MAKAKKTKKTVQTVDSDIARKIWLAGVGAYGRMFTETQGAVEKLASSANDAFDQLVAKGEEVEDKVRETITKSPQGGKVVSMMGAATEQVQTFRAGQRAALEARIGKVRKSVSDTLAPLNVGALGQAIEKLSAQVESLSREVATLKAAKAAPTQTPAVKAAPAVKAVAAKAAKPKTVKAVKAS